MIGNRKTKKVEDGYIVESRNNHLPRWTWLILGVLLLYFAPALLLELSYGPSYNLISFDNHWVPDGHGGWKAVGFPDHRRPSVPSENIPLFMRIVPILLPLLSVLLYCISPLSKYVEKEADYKPTKYSPE
ncbi:MAG: hypothetical protein ACREBV_07725, partial [Candidatus Zixiibacteriota bacterium]